MKKKLYLLLILPVLFVGINSVNAVDTPKKRHVTTVSKNLSLGGVEISLPNIGTGYFYDIKIDGVRALCMNKGKRLSGNDVFVLDYAIESSSMTPAQELMAKAYFYAKSHENDVYAVLAAQIVVWAGGTKGSYEELYTKIEQGFNSLENAGYINSSEATARQYADAILATPLENSTIYVWKHDTDPDGHQKLLTDVPGIPIYDDCKLGIENELPSCNSETANIGSIHEYVYGTCSKGFDKTKEEADSNYYNYNINGKKEAKFGNYCIMSCLNNYSVTLPGHVAGSISAGDKLVWPNSSYVSNRAKINQNLNRYPFINTLQKVCKISVDKDNLKEDYEAQLKIMNEYSKEGQDGRTLYFSHAADEEPCAPQKTAKEEAETKYNALNPSGYEEAKKKYDSCKNTCKKNCAKVCGSEPTNPATTTEATNYTTASNNYTYCTKYKDAYETAKEIIKEYNGCISANANISVDYSFEGLTSSYNDPTYHGSFNLDESFSNYRCDGCTSNLSKLSEDPTKVTSRSLTNMASSIEARDIRATITKAYDLAEYGGKYYYYVDEATGKSVNEKPAGNYHNVGYSNMPISNNIEGTYNLELHVDSISGNLGDMGRQIVDNMNSYKCNYNVTKPIDPVKCECPSGSPREGESLDCKLNIELSKIEIYTKTINGTESGGASYFADTKAKCSDLQTAYCYSKDVNYTSPPEELEVEEWSNPEFASNPVCGPDYCEDKNTHEPIDITACVKFSGKTYAECLAEEPRCAYNTQPLTCTDCYGKTYDITECSKTNGYAACAESVCHLSSVCDRDITYCPNDPSMNLTPCLNTGATKQWCIDNYCNKAKKWVCPAGTNEGMDLTSCVIPMIQKGFSEEEAYEYCEEVTCPYGRKIIYRVIDLTNPFPSKFADDDRSQKHQTGLSVGMFNDELIGRYPGSNWNGVLTVHQKILNNRSVDGDKVYNKEPLYTFIVNSENIKAIREYNKAQHNSYSDFNLKCLMNNSAACKSYFVHDAKYGLKGGTCSRCTSQNCFYTCDD